jgi:hypothetical protein
MAIEEGYAYRGTGICRKCGEGVLEYTSPLGQLKTFNPVGGEWPEALHQLHCGDRDPVAELPPPVDQWARCRELGLDPDALMAGTPPPLPPERHDEPRD